jgi:hypothetical protein
LIGIAIGKKNGEREGLMQRAERDPLNRLTRAIDRFQRYRLGIREFSSDPDCIYRLSIESAPRDAVLPDGTEFQQGQPIGILHLWGDHVPVIPSAAGNLAWAAKMVRAHRRSANLLAQHVAENRALQSIPVFGNDSFFLYTQSTASLLEKMGFVVLEESPDDCLHKLARMRTVRLWTWLLRRAFNQQSIRGIKPSDLQYRSIWLSRRTLMEKYASIGMD